MNASEKPAISFFEKYLTFWVLLCMGAGVLVGMYLPGVPQFLARFEYAHVSIPIAALIWLMIYPMMLKVDFQSIKNVGKNPKGLFVTWSVNWLIKPFSMFFIAWVFFYFIFKAWIPPELARDYLAGAVLLGAAPCHGDGLCLEPLDQGRSRLHRRAGRYQRSDYPRRVHADCRAASRHRRHRHPLGHAAAFRRPVRGDPTGGGNADTQDYREKARG